MPDTRANNVTVQLRDPNAPLPPVAPVTIQMNGKTYRITSLRIRDHGGQEWRVVTPDQAQLNKIAEKCGELFNNLKPTTETDLKKMSFTFEIGNSGFLGRNKNSTLGLKKIDYVDPHSKNQTFEVSLEAYAAPDQQRLKQSTDSLLPLAKMVFTAHPQKRPTLQPPAVPPVNPTPVQNPPSPRVGDSPLIEEVESDSEEDPPPLIL